MKIETCAVRREEIYRYLGYRGREPEEAVREMAEKMLEKLLAAMTPRCLARTYNCHVAADRVFLADDWEITSKSLAAHLDGCDEVVVFGATLGAGSEQLMRRQQLLSMAEASVLQACGAACIEAYCDLMTEEMRKSLEEKGRYLRPRFSPGYGDLPLATQRRIFAELEMTKRLGVTLTDSLLMIPTKSVTAFIGISAQEAACRIGGCRQCKNTGCEFRNEF